MRFDYNPYAAPPVFDPLRQSAPPSGSAAPPAAQEAAEDAEFRFGPLLLTYEPELTLAWQIAHFTEKGSTDSIVGVRRGAMLDSTLSPTAAEIDLAERGKTSKLANYK
ncbi:MAG: hypothetical protein BWZ10_01852 [candidate division BRC1 bacterium ADurb.BinA364]|nr:MAG: hypothetical protein BWZ10_01852 [candidate division BRC1 bacterium ADurb.BinA364]